jgi:hypothetical protein
MYVHVPTVWVAYIAFTVTAVCSGLYLFGKKHSLGFDRFAGASAEIGVAFMALTLVTGMLWGRITWGVYWQWDARLTTTALLFVSYIGYLAVRGLGGSPTSAPSAARSSGCSSCSRSRSSTGRCACGGASTRTLPCSTPAVTSRSGSHAVQPVRRRDRVLAALHVAAAPPGRHQGDGGPDRRAGSRPGARCPTRRGGPYDSGRCSRWTTPGSSSAATSITLAVIGAFALAFLRRARGSPTRRRRRQVLDLNRDSHHDRPVAPYRT